jgi:hypothetical protein
VREERRMRVESSPQGKLVEALISTAYAAHPYGVMPGGWASDIENFRRPEAEKFYKTYYTPANVTIGIAGDVNPPRQRSSPRSISVDYPLGRCLHPCGPSSPNRRVKSVSPSHPRRNPFWRSPIRTPTNIPMTRRPSTF